MTFDLVTGAAGMLGRALVDHLRHLGRYVRGVDVSPRPTGLAMDDYAQVDLRTPADAMAALRPPEGTRTARLWHLAANHGGVGYTSGHAPSILADNVRIDANVADAARTLGYTRLLYASSVAVYPERLGPPRREHEARPAEPANDYGWAKLTGERLALGTPGARVVRLENCYGPHPEASGERAGVIPALCRRASAQPAGAVLDVWGDPELERAFLWVDDAVSAVMAVMGSEVSTPVNVSTGEYVTIGHVADLVCELTGKALRPVFTGARDDRPTPHRARLDPAVIRSLGWTPTTSLRDGITCLLDAERPLAPGHAR